MMTKEKKVTSLFFKNYNYYKDKIEYMLHKNVK